MESTIENIVNEVYEKHFSVSDNFISEGEILLLQNKIDELNHMHLLKKAGIGKNTEYTTNEAIRGDSIYWLEKNDEDINRIFFAAIDMLMQQLNRRFFRIKRLRIAFYKPGTFYKKHRDSFRADDARKITVLLYLNNKWEKTDGGELLLYTKNQDPFIIEPLGGRLLVFESDMEHELLMSKANRYSITGWIKNKSRLV